MVARSSAFRRRAFVRSLPVFGLSMCVVIPVASAARAQALPQGGVVVAGNAQIGGTSGAMKITQSSGRAIIDWNAFSIGDKASVRIENGTGATLNRVTGSSVSSIDGLLSATGSVYLINKNGIVIGKSGQIDVGGRFVGSTQDITNQSFLAGGSETLQGASEAPIVNYGKIGSLGGDVALVAAKVENQGEITAANGTVGLLAGYQVVLRDQSLDEGKFSVVVGGAGTSATNVGAIRAAEAELRAQGGNVYALAGNTGGVINAKGVTSKDGRVFLTAGDGGQVTVSGAVTARKADGQGGAIEATGTHILLDDGAKLDASGTTGGSVLVGGDWQGGADASKTIANHDVAHADAVVMTSGAKIDVSGTKGAGGKAVLWSDKYTNFLGMIAADGATDGGLVETSSKINLQAMGSVSAKAGSGISGQWLLDPADITISSADVNTTSSGFGTVTFTPTANSATVSANTIMASLNAGTNVTISTTSTPAGATTQNGDITLAAGTTITKSAGSDATLTLLADRNIVLNGNITSTVGKLNVDLNARANNGASGTIAFNGAITTNGGNITAWGGNGGVNTGAAINTTGAAGIAVGAVALDAGGGNITMTGSSTFATATSDTGAVHLAAGSAVRTSGAGAISLTGTSTNGWGVVNLGAITTASGAISLTGSGTLGVITRNAATITSGSGNISLIGTGTSNIGAGIDSGSNSLVPAITSTSGNISLTGTSNSNGVFLSAAGGLTISTGGAGAVTLTGTGGTTPNSGYAAAAVVMGNTATSTKATITAGTGGLTIKGTGTGSATHSIYGNLTTDSVLSSAGGIDISQNNMAVYLAGQLQRTSTLGNFTVASAVGNITLGTVSSAGDLTITGQGNVNTTSIAQTGTTGAVTVTAQTGAITTGAINLATSDATALTAGTTLTTGAISTSGSGNITLSAGSALTTAAISKTATATGASNLTIKSGSNITVGSAISAASGAGAMNVLFNTASTGGPSGTLAINAAVTTRGGSIRAGSGTDASGAVTSNGAAQALYILGALDTSNGASGGDVTLIGANIGSGYATAVSGAITAGSGKITLSGTAVSATGLQANGNLTTTGDIVLTGISTTGVGLYSQGGSGMSWSGANIALTGNSTATSGGSIGLWLNPINGKSLSVQAANALTLSATGGSGGYTGAATGDVNAAAIVFGSSGRYAGAAGANGSPTLSLIGGAGGVAINGTSTSATGQSIDSWPVASSEIATGLNITSGGAVTLSGNRIINWRGNITQTGAGNIDINSSAGSIYLPGSITKTAAATGVSTLTIKSAADITIPGTISAASGAGALNVNLNSRSADAATGLIALTGNITTQGGNIYAWGGSGAANSAAAISSGVGGGVGVSSTLDAGGGNIVLTGANTASAGAADGIGIASGSVLRTTGSGAITLTGSNSNTGSSGGYGVSIGTATISTGAGAVTMTGSAATASQRGLSMLGTITTTSGNINLAGSASSSSLGLYVAGTVQAGGAGAINLTGTSANSAGAELAAANITSASGNIAISGTSAATGSGLTLRGATIRSTAGNITATGTGTGSTSDVGIYMPNSGTLAITADAGDVTIVGSSVRNVGIYLSANATANISGNNVVLTGTSTGSTTAADSAEGIALLGGTSGGLTVSANNGITVTATGGGSNVRNGGTGMALAFGSSGNAARASFTANGAGGVTIKGNGAAAGAVAGMDTYPDSASANVASNLKIVSAGSVNLLSDVSLRFRGAITQTAGGDSQIVSTGTTGVNDIIIGSFNGTGGGSLTIGGMGWIRSFGTVTTAGNLIVNATGATANNGYITIDGAVSAGGYASLIASNGAVTTGTVGLGGNTASLIKSATGTITTGAITLTGNGDLTLDAGAAITTAAISKTAAATGASNLTVKSTSDVTVTGAITAASGAGAFNVNLNSRSADAGTGRIGVAGAITTRGGNVYAWGGSGAANSAAAISNTTVQGVLVASTVDAGGGDIVLTGTNIGSGTSTDGVGLSGTLRTTGTGVVTLTGSSTNSAGGHGVTINAAGVISTAAGAITLTGNTAAGTSGARGVSALGTMSTTSGNIILTGTSTSSATGLYLGGSITAGGAGTIGLTGTAASGNGAGIVTNGVIVTSGSGAITINGTSNGATNGAFGVNFSGATVRSTSGNITVTAANTNNGDIALYIPTGPVTIAAGTGDVTMTGTAKSNVGFYIGTNITTSISGRNVTITGTSTGTTSAADSGEGVLIYGNAGGGTSASTTITGTNSVTINATGGGSSRRNGGVGAAMSFGATNSGGLATITAGAGGVTLQGSTAAAGGSMGIDSFYDIAGTSGGDPNLATKLTINSAGSVNLLSDRGLYFRGAITQTGGGDSQIVSTAASGRNIQLNSFTGTGGGSLTISTAGWVSSYGNIATAGNLTVNATGTVANNSYVSIGGNVSAGGFANIVASNGAVTTGTVGIGGSTTGSVIRSVTAGVTTGAITINGTSDLTVDAAADLTLAAVTKKAAATGASNLLVKTTGNLTVANAILAESGAGALNVGLNSRSAGAASGKILISNSITTRGGNIYGWGGSGAANSGAAVSATNSAGVRIDTNAILDAAGGNIAFSGSNNGSATATGYDGLYLDATARLTTSGAGTVTLSGTSTSSASYNAIVYGKIQAENGAVSVTGTGAGARGIDIRSGGAITTTGGNLTLVGSGTIGVYMGGGTVLTTGSGNLSVTGTGGADVGIALDGQTSTIGLTSTSGNIALTGTSASVAGIYGNATGGLTITTGGAGAVSLLGTGGAAALNSGLEAAAIKIGYTGGTATKATIAAGTGGLTMKGTGNGAAVYSIYTNPLTTDSTFSSAGGMDIGGNNLDVVLNGKFTQTGTQASTISSTAGNVTFGVAGQANSFAGALTASGKNVTVNGTLTQAAATNSGALALTATGSLTTGAISWATGDMALTAVSSLTTPAITKMAGALGTSTLTVKTDGDLTVGAAIQAATGAGPLNVVLNSRAHDAATGAINLNAGITTLGGNVLMRGGSAVATTPVDPTADNAGFVSALNATGAQIVFGASSAINAGGGDIELRGVSATTNGLVLNQALATSGSGNIRLYGLGGTGAAASGIDVTGAAISTVNGTLTIAGATRSTGSGSGVIVEQGGMVTSSNGSIAISGAGSTATSATSVGVAVAGGTNSSRIAVNGGSGTLTIAGKGGAGASSNFGVAISGGSTNPTRISSASSGATTITGIGGSGTGTTNYGVYLDQGSSATPVLDTTGAGALTVKGTVAGGTTYGIFQTNGARIGNGGSGNITLTANKMMLAGANAALFNTTGVLTLRPEAGGAFTVDGDILPSVFTANAQRGTYGSIVFGSTDAASLLFRTTADANTYTKALTLASGGALTIGGTTTLTANGGVSFVGNGAVSQGVDIVATQIGGTASALYLMNSGNQIAAINGLTVAGDSQLYTSSALTVKGTNSANTALLRTAGALTIDAGATMRATGFGSALNLVTATSFVNNGGASALATPAGRWLVWSQDPANDTVGGLNYAFVQYGGGYGSTTPGQTTGNGLMYGTSPTLTITLTGNYVRDYDGTLNAVLGQSNFQIVGLANGDTATVYSTATFDTKNVGTGKTITADDLAVIVRSGAVRVYGYSLTDSQITGTIGQIDQKLLTANLTGAISKVYDGSATAALTGTNYGLTGVIGSEVVTIVGPTTGLYADKNAGTNKLVTASGLTLTGADAANYRIADTVSGNVGTITAKLLTASLTGTISKVYDGSTLASVGVGNVALSGVVDGDTVAAASDLTGVYADKNAGTGKTVTANGVTLTGSGASNYTVATAVSGDVGTITAKALTLTAVTDTKTYDGTTASAGIVRANGLVGGDTFSATQIFSDQNAGSRTLQVADGYSITDGNGGGNYVVTKGADVAGTITKRLITTTLTANDKVYDATLDATGSFSALVNAIDGDDVLLDTTNGRLSFLDRNAGAGKAVTAAGYALTGAAAANYTLGAIGNGAATISRAALTLTAVTDTKTYDGTTASGQGAGITASGLKGADTLISATQKFADKNAGTGKALTVDSWNISDGNGGNNYAVTVVDNTTGVINQKVISGSLTGTVSKVYDGSTAAILTGTALDGVIAGDTVTVSATSAAYADKNVGTGKLVTVSGMALGGTDGANYVLQNTNASANVGTITARQINVVTTGTGAKTYDRTVDLTNGQLGTIALTASDADTLALMQADGVTFVTSGMSGTLADRNAGTGKVVTLSGYALNGNTLGNYALVGSTAQAIADVARATLTLTAATDSKTYDGTTASTAYVQSSGLIAGDTVSATQHFDSKDAGDRSLVVDSWNVTDGNGGGNYTVVTNTAIGAIAKRLVTTTFTADNKVYDGTRAATGTFGDLTNLVAGETVGVTGTLTFADKNAGTGKTVTVSNATLTGSDGRNYELSPVANAVADISKASLVLTAGTDSRQYDGTTASSASVVATGLAAGDSFTATQHYDDKNAGSRNLIVDAGYSVTDGNGGNNYTVTLANALGEITKRVLTSAVTVDSKTYDGTTAATGTFGDLTNIVLGETVTVSGGTLAFVDRNAGVDKAVTVTGATLGGADAANYTLANLASGTGTINKANLVLTAVTDSRAYDGTLASAGQAVATGLVAGDGVLVSQVFDGKNAGSHMLQVGTYTVLDGNNGNNYTVSLGDAVAGTITQKVLNATVSVNDKVYDGTTAATGSVTGLDGVVSGDTVSIDLNNGALTFVDRNAGNGKAVTVSGLTLSGTDASNYSLSNVGAGSANISRATLTLTASGDSKTYDGTTASAGTVGISGLVGTDTASATQAFDSKNAGTRTLSADTWSITDGNNGGNYTIVKVTADGSIAQKQISGTLTGTVSKVYDGTETATLLGTNLDGVIAGDAVTVSADSATYADKNAGTGKLVTVSGMALNGADAANYVLDQTSASANVGTITARAVTVTVSGTGSKTYDGTKGLAGNQLGSLAFALADGDSATQALLSADGVTADLAAVTGLFADRNAGTGKGVTLSGYTLANNGLGNYALSNSTVQGLADVARAALTLTAVTDSKTYDGTTASTGAVLISGLMDTDTASATQAFDSKNAGTRTLSANGWSITDGNDGGNYTIVKVDATGTIAQKLISGSLLPPVSKVYDGTDTATILGTNLDGVITGDTVTVSASSATYADKNVGTNKLVTVSGMALGGVDAANYVLEQTSTSANVGTITARTVTVSATGTGSKTYDGTTGLVAGNLGSVGLTADADAAALMAADGVTLDGSTMTGTLADRNAGTGKSATLAGFALSGNDFGNYVLANSSTQGVVDVARRALTISAVTDSKTYDGTTVSRTFDITGLVDGDTGSATQVFDSKNAGDRTLTIGSWSITDGNNGGNYVVITADIAGTIAKRIVTGVVSVNDKVYDGTIAATGTFDALANMIAGDQVTATADLAFADKNAGASKAVTASNTALTGADAGNYELSSLTLANDVATISKANLVLTAGTDSRQYDGTTASSGIVVATGLAAGDSFSATQRYDDKNAGSRNLIVDAGYSVTDGNDSNNYNVTLASTAGEITKRVLTSSVTVDTKTYDGSAAATGTFGALDNIVLGETVTITGGTLTFADRNAGVDKAVTVTGATLGGADAANYTLANLASGTGTINKANLVLTAVTDSRAYDGTTASAGLVATSGLITGDGVSATQVFDGKDAGSHMLQVAGYTVFDGNNGNNYTVSLGDAVAGTITRKALSATVSVNDKVYDGSTATTGSVTGLSGVIEADLADVMWGGDGTFAFVDRNAGNGKAVTVSGLTLSGAASGNYMLADVANGTANITKAQLTLTAVGDTKTYDGTTGSTGMVLISGLVGDDTGSATQVFDSKNAGSRALTVNGWTIIDGNGGGNYAVTTVAADGSIAQKQLSGSLTGTISKVYDGTTNAVLAGANLDGVIAGDVVTVSAANATYADKNAGTGKLVTVSGMTLDGADAANYILGADQASAAIGTITARVVGVASSGSGAKTYDGTIALGNGQLGTITLTASDADTLALMQADGISFDISGMSGTLNDRNAGTGKIVTLAGYALTGNDLGNYALSGTAAQAVANVARATLVLTAGTDSKTYDGTTASAGTVQYAGLVGDDTVSATQHFDGKDAGGRTLVVDGWTVTDGNGGGNYAVVTNTAAGTIAKRLLTTTVIANDKVYDGTTVATGTFGDLANLVAGETVGVTGTLSFADKNAGTYKAVSVANATLTGSDARNYELSPVTSALATISKANLVLTAGTDSRQYDGTTASSANVVATGLAAGDSFTATQHYDDKNAGSRNLIVDAGYSVTDGNGGNNYNVTLASTVGTIAKRVLSSSVSVDTKTYDGTTSATGTFGALDNVVLGETVTVTGGTLAFANRNAGTDKAVTVTGATLGGADAANYTLANLASGTGTINKANLVLTAVTDSRAYDGTTVSAGQVLANGLVAGDGVTAVQNFDGKNAGGHMLQVGTYTVLDGNNGGNYTVSLGDAVAGTITQKVLNATASVNNKTYDGTIVATGSVTGLYGVVGSEDVSVNGSGLFTFVDRNAGNGKAVTVTGLTLSGVDAGNYTLSSVANGTANIARAVLTLTASGDSKTYDGTTASTGAVLISGLVSDDTATATQAFDSKNAGTRTLSANAWTITDGNDGGNYTVVRVTADGSIAQKLLSGALTGTVSKVYDGTTVATLLGTNLDGVIAGDAVTVSADSATYADKNAGTGKLVTVSGMALNGADAANYVLDQTTASANVGTITARTVTVSATGTGSKTYDGTTALSAEQLGTLQLIAANGDSATQALMAADGVTLGTGSVTGVLADRNAGTGKSVIFTGFNLSGNDFGNYVLSSDTALGVANIARAVLTLTASNDGKVYDGTTSSTGTVSVSGLIDGDTLTTSQAFDSKNAGDRSTKVAYTLDDDNGGGNYIVTLVDGQGTIAKRSISTSLTVQDKTYDGTTTATGVFAPLTNLVAGDDVGVSAQLAFADKNAGTNKLVTIGTSTLTGADAANYELDPVATTGTATINKASLVLNAVTDVRQYDGTTASSGQVQAVGLVTGDSVSATQSFDGKNAGAHALTVDGGYSVNDGNDGGNYIVTIGNTASGAITQRVLTASATVNDKTYDGTRTATGSLGNLTNVVAGEDVQLSGGTLTFVDRNAGTGKAVNVSGATLSGADAANYILSDVTGATGTINQATLVLNAVDDTKVYDGTAASGGRVIAVGLVGGDVVAATQSYDSKNAGGRAIAVDGSYTIADGNGGGNYIVTIGTTANGTITAKQVQVSSNVNSKTYDGTTAATGSITGLSGIVTGDAVQLGGSAQFAFADRNAGNGKVVNVSGITLTGADAGNYVVGTVANGTANIAKAVLTLTASGDSKTYDGTATSAGTVSISGLAAGDTATANQAFDSKNAGSRILSATDWAISDGNDGGNYTVVKVTADGTIARKLLTGALTGTVTKVYDGTTDASLLPVNIDGVVAGDALTLTVAGASYADKNVGTGKLVTVSGMALNGADAGNYELMTDSVAANVGTITARMVGIGTTGLGGKTYDGTTLLGGGQLGTLQFTAADGDAATQALLLADGVLLDASAVTGLLADRNAGTGKSVDLTGFALTNNGAGNYVLAPGAVHAIADIARAVLTLTASGDTKLYDGTTVSGANVIVTGLVAGDTASATQAFDDRNAGGRNLVVTGYTLDDANGGGNYTVQMVSANGTIDQRSLDIAIGNASKTVGGVDPSLTYTVIGGDGLVQGDALTGQVARDSGETAGTYTVAQGSLSAGSNYKLNITPGVFTIVADAGTGGGGTTPGTGGDTGGGTTPGTGGDTGGGTTPGTGGDTGGGTTPGTGGDTGGGTTPGTGGDTGGGTTPGTGGGTTPGTGGGTPDQATIIRTAQLVGEQTARAWRDTSATSTTLQAGIGGPFDAGAVFAFQGASRLPGGVATSVQDEGTLGALERTGLSAELLACTGGAQDGDSCGAGRGSGLPYPTNRIVSSVLRFLGR